MPTYTIVSDYYANYSMTVHGPFVIAYGAAEAIAKAQKINVTVKNADDVIVHVSTP